MKNIKNISLLVLMLFVSLFLFGCKENIVITVENKNIEIYALAYVNMELGVKVDVYL